ncbi:hypothetical protein LUZ61_000541 [Rhynchospora tenuis]|uniref:Uncharacterized protein n=1 Tax=Rhynchospora tenuis TaxID=198213 RepID=A0AAD6EPZ4_9POAL|nr:hypothetical protein LUZ61_000541 [Rhynchospora tenuis]
MSCIQATTTYKPSLGPVVRRHKRLETVCSAPLSSIVCYKSTNLAHAKLACSASKYKRLTPICSIGGAGDAASSDDPFSMESLKKAMEGMKQEKPLQDALKEKMRELDFGGDGGAGKRPPRGGGSGGSGASDGPASNFNEWLDEALQVFLATIGLISVYVYIVRGEELVLLARDYIKYLIWGKKSMRLAEKINK